MGAPIRAWSELTGPAVHRKSQIHTANGYELHKSPPFFLEYGHILGGLGDVLGDLAQVIAIVGHKERCQFVDVESPMAW